MTPKQALTGATGAYQSGGTAIPALDSSKFIVPFVDPGVNGVPPCGLSTAGNPVCDVFETGWGPAGQRNIFREAFQSRGDISFVKSMPVTERVSLKYTFDIFNVTNTPSFDIPYNSVSGNPNYNNAPTYDSTQSVIANRQSVYSINSNNTLQQNLGLGVVQDTIGSPRLISMSMHVMF